MKTGRKQKHHHDSKTGLPVVGLSSMGNGRWRAIGSQYRFTEHDEQKAIARYLKYKAEQGVPADLLNDGYEGSMAFGIVNGFVYFDVPGAKETPEEKMWRWIGQEIRKAPELRARMSGIEEIAYFQNIKPPEPLPTPKEIEAAWTTYSTASKPQKRKIVRSWKDFVSTTGIRSIKEIDTKLVIDYRDKVYARSIAHKSMSHLFTSIRRMVSFCKERGTAVEALDKVLQQLALLVPMSENVTVNPMPIEVIDFHLLLKQCDDDNRALLMLMLNGAFYMQEVIRLNWSDIKDGCIVTHRQKKGKIVRCCVLWQETIDALAKIHRTDGIDYIFKSYTGARLGIKGADKRFRTIRHKAAIAEQNKKLDELTSSQLRDGAWQAAAEANVNSDLCNMLVGHRNGLPDNYVKRKPSMVAPACEAIRKHYQIENPPTLD